jgi:hypothetical protein
MGLPGTRPSLQPSSAVSELVGRAPKLAGGKTRGKTMADLRLACTGARVGMVIIPPFSLRAGELICLHLPYPLPAGLQTEILGALTGKHPATGLRLFGRVLPAIPARDDRIAPFRLLRTLRATRWLRQQARISRNEASAALRRIGLDQDWPLTHLAGNPRTLLGLEAAWAAGAEAIVNWTNCCDPSGVRAVHMAVTSRLATCPAIHLSLLRFQDGRPVRDCLPGFTCVDLIDSSTPPLRAETA